MGRFVLALGMFAIGVDGFVLSGILTPIAQDLSVSVESAGQLETAFALTLAILSPVVVVLLGRVRPRAALTGSLIAFAAFNALAAIAPWFVALMAARVMAALSIGVFMALAPTVAARTAPEGAQGRAIATVTAGMTAGIVLGVPTGILLTNLWGWRWSFWLVTGLSLIAAVGCSTQFRGLSASRTATVRERVAVLRRPDVLVMITCLMVWMVGGYVLYVYMGPALQEVAGVSRSELPWIFFGFGVASILGNFLGGVSTDRFGVVTTLLVGLGGGGLGLLLVSLLAGSKVGVLSAVLLWSLAGWMLTPPQMARLLALAPAQAPVLLSVNSSAMYLGMGLGGFLGGFVSHSAGLRHLGWVGFLFELVAIVLVLVQHRSTAVAPQPAMAKE